MSSRAPESAASSPATSRQRLVGARPERIHRDEAIERPRRRDARARALGGCPSRSASRRSSEPRRPQAERHPREPVIDVEAADEVRLEPVGEPPFGLVCRIDCARNSTTSPPTTICPLERRRLDARVDLAARSARTATCQPKYAADAPTVNSAASMNARRPGGERSTDHRREAEAEHERERSDRRSTA